MGKTILFKDFGKTGSDLLSKDFKTGENNVEVKTKTSNGVEFTPKAKIKGNSVDGSLVGKYNFSGGIKSEATVSTSGALETTLEACDAVMKGLNVKLECKTGEKSFLSQGNVSAQYQQDSFNAKVNYDYFKSKAGVNFATSVSSVTLGADVGLSTRTNSLTNYSAALQFAQPDFTLMAKLADPSATGQNMQYTGSYFHKVSPSMQVSTEITKSDADADVGLQFGCMYNLDSATTVKGKVDVKGEMTASYKQTISSLTSLTLAAKVDIFNLQGGAHKVGMALNLTP